MDNIEEYSKEMQENVKRFREAVISLNKKKVICNYHSSMIFESDDFEYSSEYYEYFSVKKESDYTTITSIKIPEKIYEIGKFNDISINVDPSMTWGDNRILDEDKNLLIDIKKEFPKLIGVAILG